MGFGLIAVLCLIITGCFDESDDLTGAQDAGGAVDDTISVFDYDRSLPLNVSIAVEEPGEGFMRLDLTYASPAGGRVPAYLYIPDGEGPFPAVVVMHGMPGSRRNADGLASYHARNGAVAIAITAPHARPYDDPRRNPILLTAQDRDEQIQLIQDLMRAVDLLSERTDVDADRIVYEGVSYGGAMGGLLAGVETRIRAYALVVGDGGLVAHVTGPEDAGGRLFRMPASERQAWLDAMNPIEPINWVGRAVPAELLFQNGRQDPYVPPADGRAYQEAGSEPKTVMWYDAGHGLNDRANADRRAWLAERMGL